MGLCLGLVCGSWFSWVMGFEINEIVVFFFFWNGSVGEVVWLFGDGGVDVDGVVCFDVDKCFEE